MTDFDLPAYTTRVTKLVMDRAFPPDVVAKVMKARANLRQLERRIGSDVIAERVLDEIERRDVAERN